MTSPGCRPIQTLTRRLIAGGVVALSAMLTTGCISGRIGGNTEPDVVINELRDNNLQLQRELEDMQKAMDLRLAEIDTLRQQLQSGQTMPGVDAPRAVTIKIDKFTSAIDTNRDERDDLIRIYIKPLDQQGRFLVVAGKASMQAVAIRTKDQPVVVAQAEYEPEQWQAAYRTGITGTHYTLDLPLPDRLPRGVKELTVQVSLTDAATGATLTQQTVVAVR